MDAKPLSPLFNLFYPETYINVPKWTNFHIYCPVQDNFTHIFSIIKVGNFLAYLSIKNFILKSWQKK
jgi:hypothetical protein